MIHVYYYTIILYTIILLYDAIHDAMSGQGLGYHIDVVFYHGDRI